MAADSLSYITNMNLYPYNTFIFEEKKAERSCIERAGDCVKNLANSISEFVQGTFRLLGYIRGDGFNFGRALRLCNYTFKGIEHFFNKPAFFSSLADRFSQTDDFIDTINVLETVQYFSLAKYADDDAPTFWGNTFLGIAAVSGCFLFADEMSLGEAAAWLGNIPGVGSIVEAAASLGITLEQVATGSVGAAFAFFGYAAFIRIFTAENQTDKNQAILDLVWCIAEVVSKIFVFAECTCVPLVLGLGVIAAVLGLIAFGYRLINNEKPHITDNPQIALKPY